MMIGYVPFLFFLIMLGNFKESALGQLLVKAYHFFPVILYVAVIAKYGMVLPATAIGKRSTLKYFVGLTQGHFRQSFLVLSIPPLLSLLAWQLFSGVVELPKFGAVSIAVRASWVLMGVFEVVVLSMCFQKLREVDLAGSDEPAVASG